jgi:general secretion pathway protein A
MYETYWNVGKRPFENRFDADFYYPSESHQAALLKLRYAIENRRSAVALCGGSGMGKSLVVQALLRQLPEFVGSFVTVLFPAMESAQLIRYIANRMEHPIAPQANDLCSALERIERILGEGAKNGLHGVIVIDEAHLLEEANLLEPLRLLLNVFASQGQGESAATLVLSGQPTLLPQLERHMALEERVAVRCVLNRFSADETVAYLGHRLRTAGTSLEKVFSPSALDQIQSITQGVPRRINRLCDLAMMVGFAQEATRIDADMILQVNGELTTPAMIS